VRSISKPNGLWAPSSMPGLTSWSSDLATYGEFRKNLKKNYVLNSVPLATTWLGIILIFFTLWNTYKTTPLVLIFVSCVLLTLLAHRLLLIIHEGAHMHFAKNTVLNDFLTNLLAGIFLGTEVATYRKIHTLHHRNIGNSGDPENSYENEFDFSWLLTVLSGLYTIKTFRKRQNKTRSWSQFIISVLTIFLHSAIAGLLITNEKFTLFIVWFASWFIFMPGLAASRNLIEHRFLESSMHLEIETTLVGFPNVTSKLFTLRRSSKIFGAMGFDRHLIHHWDPSISARNLAEVHKFLLTTQLSQMLIDIPTTYTSAAKNLWSARSKK
jgi:fatty acid desaturase